MVGNASTRLLTDLADKTGLTSGFVQAFGLDRVRRPAHEPGRVAVDLAVLLADGGEAIADLAVLRQQPGLFGPVASDPTAWQVLDAIDTPALARLRAARAAARELAWLQLLETRRWLPVTTVLGRAVPGFVLDIDATIVPGHSEKSEKEAAAATWKHAFGSHPLLCFLDATGEALAGMLRPGNAGSNTAAHHITVLGRALQQTPDGYRYGSPILIRSDSAGSSHEFLAHVRGLREHGVHSEFSVGVAITKPVRAAITAASDWVPALNGDDSLRNGAELVELTNYLNPGVLDSFPAGTRLIRRRERPHPGAQLLLFDTINGMRHQVFATDASHGAVTAVRDQRRLARTRPDRHRPALLDPTPAPGRATGNCRAEEAALPAAAHRRETHPHRPHYHPAHRPGLALDQRPHPSLRRPRRATRTVT